MRWIRLLGLTPWTTSTTGSSSSNSDDGGGGGAAATVHRSLLLAFSLRVSLFLAPSIPILSSFSRHVSVFLSRSLSVPRSLSFSPSVALRFSCSASSLFHAPQHGASRFFNEGSAQYLGCHNLPAPFQGGPPATAKPTLRLAPPRGPPTLPTGEPPPSTPSRSHSSSQFLTFRSTFPSGRAPGTTQRGEVHFVVTLFYVLPRLPLSFSSFLSLLYSSVRPCRTHSYAASFSSFPYRHPIVPSHPLLQLFLWHIVFSFLLSLSLFPSLSRYFFLSISFPLLLPCSLFRHLSSPSLATFQTILWATFIVRPLGRVPFSRFF